MSYCINTSHPEFKNLLQTSGLSKAVLSAKIGTWMQNNTDDRFPTLSDLGISDNTVKASLKIISALEKLQRNVFTQDKLQGWLNDLTKQGVSLQQLEMFKETVEEGMTKNDIMVAIAANYSYTVEINTAKTNEDKQVKQIGDNEEFNFKGSIYEFKNNEYLKDDEMIDIIEYESAKNEAFIQPNTQHYSNLTVPGGTNYTENEIATPAITPSIKGHAQFATPQGIGWFRSDESVDRLDTNIISINEIPNNITEIGNKDEIAFEKRNGEWYFVDSNTNVKNIQMGEKSLVDLYNSLYSFNNKRLQGSKTRRILEVQSDLFQKGRNENQLVGFIKNESKLLANEELLKRFGATDESLSEERERVNKGLKQNQFLQLLNKENNWVTFFVRSIIQDSAKKGYEKVLFPVGDTAAKIEGHETVEEFINNKQERLKKLQVPDEQKYMFDDYTGTYDVLDPAQGATINNVKTKEEAIKDYNERFINKEKEQLEKEIEDAKAGKLQISSIANFYETTIYNILKKQGYNPVRITDEYGNSWNEVVLKEKDNDNIDFSIPSSYEIPVTKKQIEQDLGVTIKSSFIDNNYYVKLKEIVKRYNDGHTHDSHYQVTTKKNTKPGADPYSSVPVFKKYSLGSNKALERTNKVLTKSKDVKDVENNQLTLDFDTPVTVEPVKAYVKEQLPINKLADNVYEYAGEIYSDENLAKQARLMDDSIDELIPNGSKQIERTESIRKQKIQSAIIKQKDVLRNSKTPSEQKDALATIESLLKLLDKAEERTIRASNVDAYEDIVLFAKSQLAEIEKLLTNSAISADDIYYAKEILDVWEKAGDFSTEPTEHIFLDEYEFETPEVREIFRTLAAKAQDLRSQLVPIEKEHVTQFVQKFTNDTVTKEDVYNHLKDVSKITSEVVNISRLGDPVLQAGFNATEYATMEAHKEAVEIWDNLDNLTKAFLKKSGNNYEILKQKTKDGKESGRMVHRFSPEFFETRNRLLSTAFHRDLKSGTVKKNSAAVKDYFDWIAKNTISFDVRILFEDSSIEDGSMPSNFLYTETTYTEEQKAKHIQELKDNLGEKGYEYYIKRVEAKLEKFKLRRETEYERLENIPTLSQEEKDATFENWNRENSPYWNLDMAENPFNRQKGKDSYYQPKGLREYVEQVPRKIVEGKSTEWYDSNFAKIEADNDLLAYHSFMMETLNKLRYVLPENKRKLMGVGVIPTVEKSIMDMFSEKGLMIGVVPFWDKLKQLQTTTDFSTTLTSDINPLTGAVKKNIQYNFIEDTDAKVISMVKEMSIEHEQKTGKPATASERAMFRKEAKDYLSKQKSWDLTKILKAYSLSILAAKHKSFIEPQMRLLEQLVNEQKETIVNKAGQPLMVNNEVQTKEGLANRKAAFDFFMDSTYYGIGGRKVEGVTKTKLYTKEEEKRKTKLEELIKNETDPEKKQFLEEHLSLLGGFRTASGTGDALLKFSTLRGLGWNLTSGMSNMGFGVIANMIEGSDGRVYSNKSIRKAYLLTTNSIGRNISLNTMFNDPNGTATKIRTLMDNWNILQTSNKEMYDTSQKSSLSKLKALHPFTIQERTEYVNQAPVMIAVLLETKAKDSEDKEVSLWEALDSKGELKEGFTTDVDMVKVMQKVKRTVEMLHGDYNNALKAKATITGRLLTQFRTWMFEGFMARFESPIGADGKPKVDYTLSYGLDEEYVRKGRYRSYTAGQLATSGALIGSMVLPGVGTAGGALLGGLVGKFFGMQTETSVMADTLYTLKILAKKLMFSSSRNKAFEDRFSKTDAANMRKNMTELYILLGLMGVGLLLKALAGSDDEDDDFTTNILLNQTIRLQTDIGFYSNPLEFEKLTKTAVPMVSLLEDVRALSTDVTNHFGEEDKSVFQSGPFEGDSKALIHTFELLPGTSQAIRLYRTGDKVFE